MGLRQESSPGRVNRSASQRKQFVNRPHKKDISNALIHHEKVKAYQDAMRVKLNNYNKRKLSVPSKINVVTRSSHTVRQKPHTKIGNEPAVRVEVEI